MSPTVERRPISKMRAKLVAQYIDVELADLTRFKRFVHLSLKIVVMVGRDFIDKLVKLQAMALAFKTLLSLAPLLAVIFSLLKAFGVHNRMEPALAEALAPLGEKGQEITAHLIGFVNKMSAGALGSIDTDVWLPAGGVGVRFRLAKALPLNMRADFAWGRDDSTFALSIGVDMRSGRTR